MTQSPPSTLPPSRETASRSSSVLRALRFVARMTEREIEKGVGTWYGSFSPLLKRLVGVKLSSNDRECSVPMPDGQAEMGTGSPPILPRESSRVANNARPEKVFPTKAPSSSLHQILLCFSSSSAEKPIHLQIVLHEERSPAEKRPPKRE